MYRAPFLLLLAIVCLGAIVNGMTMARNNTTNPGTGNDTSGSNSTAGNDTMSSVPTTTSSGSLTFFSSLLLLPSILLSIHLQS
ncbi:unnamed protein product [Rodentolepis nana]|uniref:Expressed conserved protein n=1 Tax=Rodentolepis nana TaxID=102285 RepID=A0A0R3TD14_RODNA|nr:unnamed protein product [Rodentolepis nana]